MTNSTRTAHNAKTLPQKYYTSKEIYEAETDRIFLQRWLYAGRVSELGSAGAFFLFQLDTESLIITRDENGRFHALHNVCRHRGTRLCEEMSGHFNKRIRCPYHAWTYALDGRLIGAPNMHEVSTFRKEDYPLHRVALAIRDGCIFINLAPEPEPFEQVFAPLLHKFQKWHLKDLEMAHRIEYDVAANWKLIFQNYSECYHCPTLHPTLNRLTPFRGASNDLLSGPFLGGPMRLGEGTSSMTMSGRRCAAPLGDLSGEDLHAVYYYTIFPNMLLSLHPDYVLIHRLHRKAPDRTHITCDWLFHPDAMAQPDFDPTDAIEFWNTTNKQDWHVSELSQKGISSRAYTPGPYAELESMIAAFDAFYLKSMGVGA